MAAVVLIALVMWRTGSLFGREPFHGPTWKVRKERLKLAIVERGWLESSNNGDIVCRVKSGTKGSTNATTIRWLVDAGTEVKGPEWKKGADWKKDVLAGFCATAVGFGVTPLGGGPLAVSPAVVYGREKLEGEKIMELDSSGLYEQLLEQNIVVDQTKAAYVFADEEYRIQKLDNESDIEKAENALELAKIDLEKYKEGDFVQSLKDVEGRTEIAKSDLESWKDRAGWSRRMWKKGLGSKVQADADESRVDGARINLQKVEEEKRVLEKYLKQRNIQDLTSKLNEARRSLEKVRSQARARLVQKESSRQSALSVYEQKLYKKRDIENEIAKCTITSPQDGMVVYYVPEQVRGGGGTQQSIVSQGEPVREGQKMLQIPDLSKMLVNVRVHEALVANLRSDIDPDDSSTWQYAQIRVDAHSSHLLKGHVMRVDTIASQQDFFSSDVKVYKTLVSIDTPMEGLKPGMSAEVTIFADETTEPVLVVPIQSVIGTISSGAQRKCYVLDAAGQPELRDIVVGKSNEQLVEVKSGLSVGEEVVQNPAPLIAANSDLRPGKVRPKNEDREGREGGEGGKKGGKKKGNGKGGFKGPAGPGGPVVGPGPGGKGNGFGGPPNAEQKRVFEEKMRNATPAQRRDMVNQIPEDKRGMVRQYLRSQNLEVAE